MRDDVNFVLRFVFVALIMAKGSQPSLPPKKPEPNLLVAARHAHVSGGESCEAKCDAGRCPNRSSIDSHPKASNSYIV